MSIDGSEGYQELQDLVKDIQTKDLEELGENRDALAGLVAMTSASLRSLGAQSLRAERNAETAKRLQDKLKSLKQLRETCSKLSEEDARLRSQWSDLEPHMHARILPFSRVGITRKLQAEIDQAKQNADSFKRQLVEATSSKDVISMTKELITAEQVAHYKESLMSEL